MTATPERVTLTEGEFDLLGPFIWGAWIGVTAERQADYSRELRATVERILSDRLRAAQADAWDRCHDDLCGNKDWAGACIYPAHANPYRGDEETTT